MCELSSFQGAVKYRRSPPSLQVKQTQNHCLAFTWLEKNNMKPKPPGQLRDLCCEANHKAKYSRHPIKLTLPS